MLEHDHDGELPVREETQSPHTGARATEDSGSGGGKQLAAASPADTAANKGGRIARMASHLSYGDDFDADDSPESDGENKKSSVNHGADGDDTDNEFDDDSDDRGDEGSAGIDSETKVEKNPNSTQSKLDDETKDNQDNNDGGEDDEGVNAETKVEINPNSTQSKLDDETKDNQDNSDGGEDDEGADAPARVKPSLGFASARFHELGPFCFEQVLMYLATSDVGTIGVLSVALHQQWSTNRVWWKFFLRRVNLEQCKLDQLLHLAESRATTAGVSVSWQRRFYTTFVRGPKVWGMPAVPFLPKYGNVSTAKDESSPKSSTASDKVSAGFQMRSFCRFRPLPASAADSENTPWYECDKSNNTVKVSEPDDTTQTYEFNAVMSPWCSQARVYYLAAREAVQCAFDGVNSTIFCYGQTGSGKTHTMFGPDSQTGYGMKAHASNQQATSYSILRDRTGMPIPRLRKDGQAASGRDLELSGIVPRACHDLLAMSLSDFCVQARLSVSYMEIYQDKVYDLLQQGVVVHLGHNVAETDTLGRESWTTKISGTDRFFKSSATAILAGNFRSYMTEEGPGVDEKEEGKWGGDREGKEGKEDDVVEGSRAFARAKLKRRLNRFGAECIWREVKVVTRNESNGTYGVQLGKWLVFVYCLIVCPC